jgi:hypothetical protein
VSDVLRAVVYDLEEDEEGEEEDEEGEGNANSTAVRARQCCYYRLLVCDNLYYFAWLQDKEQPPGAAAAPAAPHPVVMLPLLLSL